MKTTMKSGERPLYGSSLKAGGTFSACLAGCAQLKEIAARTKWLPASVVSLAVLTAVQATAAIAQDFELRLRQGYNSNVYEVNRDLIAPVAGYYTRVDLAYEAPSRSRGLSLIFRPQARVVWYPTTSSGNQLSGSLVLGLQNRWRGKETDGWRRKTTLGVELSGAYERELFLKRSTREELQIGAVDPDLPLQDLPSRLQGGAQVTLRTRATRDLTLAGGAFGRARQYVESNDPSLPPYSRLDLREFGGLVEVFWSATREWTLSGTGMWRDRLYPNRNASTLEGDHVPGVLREYWYWDAAASADFKNSTLHNTVHLVFRRRDDRFEGYYSYSAWEAGDRLKFDLTPTLDVRLRYSYGQRNYDVYAPSGSPTANQYHAGRAAVNVEPSALWRLVVGVEYERTLSNDPTFDYDGFQVLGEIRIAR
jgi:opacity protein-like surface antigen